MTIVNKIGLTFVATQRKCTVNFKSAYKDIKVDSVSGRYLHRDHLLPLFNKFKSRFSIAEVGSSVQHIPIEKVTLGKGAIKILMWSQMHGNESTTTKAVLDMLNAFFLEFDRSEEILDRITLVIIPMLNPDGALAYTRENANKVDLNRDAENLSQAESQILRQEYEACSPDFCFNLHDQRTIYSAGPFPNPATLSFLSPSANSARDVTPSRLAAMKLISTMNKELQKQIPQQLGRYDDAFNPNCVGDAFQMRGTPTVLVEAGHHQGDYQREQTRKYVFQALWTAVSSIAFNEYQAETESDYFDMPENEKLFFDVLIHNAHELVSEKQPSYSAGILFQEVLTSAGIRFRPYIEKQGDLAGFFGHKTFDCSDVNDLERLRKNQEITHLFLNA
ncbi:M14 family metallopeptidase [Muriicola soli]|nr:M14 metallopeptidase family protein [Muriicola soli]